MGMFDAVMFVCPRCHHKIEVQSKAGECVLAEIHSSQVPLDVAADLKDEDVYCEACYTYFRIRPHIDIHYVSMQLVEV